MYVYFYYALFNMFNLTIEEAQDKEEGLCAEQLFFLSSSVYTQIYVMQLKNEKMPYAGKAALFFKKHMQ